MPWLVKDSLNPYDDIFFVHIPRCGGTSLSSLYNVRQKCRKERCFYHKFGLLYFYYRYELLLNNNYPYVTWENLLGLLEISISVVLYLFVPFYQDRNNCTRYICAPGVAAYGLWISAVFMMCCSTFIFTASVTGRNRFMRRLYSVLVGRILCGFTASEDWVTGTSHQGWLLHFTAEKCLRYDLVTEDAMRDAHTIAIVRNPYARMVSLYSYNKIGCCCESFEKFVKSWYEKYKVYELTGTTDEWDVYCHVLPQFEYTHNLSDQIVKCIVRQEDLKNLGQDESSFLTDIPKPLREAFVRMPYINRRKRSKPWWEYYTQETMDLVVKMYARDFAQFKYDTNIPNREDLIVPELPNFRNLVPISSNPKFTSFSKTNAGFRQDECDYLPQESDSLLSGQEDAMLSDDIKML